MACRRRTSAGPRVRGGTSSPAATCSTPRSARATAPGVVIAASRTTIVSPARAADTPGASGVHGAGVDEDATAALLDTVSGHTRARSPGASGLTAVFDVGDPPGHSIRTACLADGARMKAPSA